MAVYAASILPTDRISFAHEWLHGESKCTPPL